MRNANMKSKWIMTDSCNIVIKRRQKLYEQQQAEKEK